MSEVFFKDDLDRQIYELYSTNTVTNLSKTLGHTRGAIRRRAKRMGLSKEKDFVLLPGEVSRVIRDPRLQGIYFVTNLSRVYNGQTGKALTPKVNGNGYPQITFQIDGKRYELRVHRLVALEFIPNPMEKPFINHIDGDKTNSSIDNLEWCTAKENAEHASRTGLLDSCTGENSNFATITESQAFLIKEALEEGLSQAAIVRKYDFATRSIVQKIANGTRWVRPLSFKK